MKWEKPVHWGNQYVEKTLAVIAFMDSLSVTEYKRSINQIYLCHDNALNAAYLPEIINRLKQKQYNIISLEEALTDAAYAQPNTYYKKWGVSWVYRWMKSNEQRSAWMKREPDFSELQKVYEQLNRE
jgi:peptidoglycan-N-acetylglucosamine deacetylase